MKDFLFTNKSFDKIFNYKINIDNFYIYSNYKINFIEKDNGISFLFGNTYIKLNNKNLNFNRSYDGRYCLIYVKNIFFSFLAIFFFFTKN